MKVHFYSKTDDFDIDFIAEATIENGFIKFKDESLEGTSILMKYDESNLIFKRVGNVVMDVIFTKGKITEGHYKNDMGLEFWFGAEVLYLETSENLVKLKYNLLIDGEYNNTCEIVVSLNNE